MKETDAVLAEMDAELAERPQVCQSCPLYRMMIRLGKENIIQLHERLLALEARSAVKSATG